MHAVSPFHLRGIHRLVGAAEQDFRELPMLRIEGNAEAAADPELLPLLHELFTDRRQ